MERESTLRSALNDALTKHDLSVADYYLAGKTGGSLGKQFRSNKGAIEVSMPGKSSWKPSSFAELCRSIVAIDRNTWTDLHVFAKMPMQQAIDCKRRVVEDIVSVLAELAPIYQQSPRPK